MSYTQEHPMVNSLGNSIKRGIMTKFISQHDPCVVLLQETRLESNKWGFLTKGRYKMVAHAGYTSDSRRGVGILIHKNFPFQVTQTWVTQDGC